MATFDFLFTPLYDLSFLRLFSYIFIANKSLFPLLRGYHTCEKYCLCFSFEINFSIRTHIHIYITFLKLLYRIFVGFFDKCIKDTQLYLKQNVLPLGNAGPLHGNVQAVFPSDRSLGCSSCQKLAPVPQFCHFSLTGSYLPSIIVFMIGEIVNEFHLFVMHTFRFRNVS